MVRGAKCRERVCNFVEGVFSPPSSYAPFVDTVAQRLSRCPSAWLRCMRVRSKPVEPSKIKGLTAASCGLTAAYCGLTAEKNIKTCRNTENDLRLYRS